MANFGITRIATWMAKIKRRRHEKPQKISYKYLLWELARILPLMTSAIEIPIALKIPSLRFRSKTLESRALDHHLPHHHHHPHHHHQHNPSLLLFPSSISYTYKCCRLHLHRPLPSLNATVEGPVLVEPSGCLRTNKEERSPNPLLSSITQSSPPGRPPSQSS